MDSLFESSLFEWIMGGIIGVIITEVYEHLIKKSIAELRKRHEYKKYSFLYSSERVREKLIQYYEKKHKLDDLHVCRIGDVSRTILYLTQSSWINLRIDVLTQNYIITINPDTTRPFKTNKAMIKKRQAIGQTLFNDPTLYLSTTNGSSHFTVKKCSFYEKLSFIDSIEKETYLYAQKTSIKIPSLRNKFYSSFERCIAANRNPTSIGCHVACIITIDGKKYICIEQRSKKTFTYGGYYALLPVFGLVDIPNHIGNDPPNVLFYNIVKEYCEEFFSVEELERNSNRTNPYWFYDQIPYAKNLIDSIKAGTSECKYLGFGFDAVNGMGILSCLLYIKDEDISKEIYKNNKANWEVETSGVGIKFVEVNDTTLKTYLQDYQYQPASAITIQMALDYIN